MEASDELCQNDVTFRWRNDHGLLYYMVGAHTVVGAVRSTGYMPIYSLWERKNPA